MALKFGTYKGSDEEARARNDASDRIKKDANTSLNLLKDQFDKLSGADSPVLRESQIEQEQGRAEYEATSKAVEQKIGSTGLAGSGSATSARENLATQFEQRQAFTQESALQTVEGDKDKITMEMHNVISGARASLSGLVGDMKAHGRDYDPGDLSAYGIEG